MKGELKGLYLDDNRSPRVHNIDTREIDWIIVRSYKEFVDYINSNGLPDIVSFDHDLNNDHTNHLIEQAGRPVHLMTMDYSILEKTGYHCAKWLCAYCLDNDKRLPPILTVHSANPIGADNILFYLQSYAKVRGETSKIYKTIW